MIIKLILVLFTYNWVDKNGIGAILEKEKNNGSYIGKLDVILYVTFIQII